MENKINPKVKSIADAHIRAKKSGVFDDPISHSAADMLRLLFAGKTFSAVMTYVELDHCSTTSLLMSGVLDHNSESYKKAIYKGFKSLLNQVV